MFLSNAFKSFGAKRAFSNLNMTTNHAANSSSYSSNRHQGKVAVVTASSEGYMFISPKNVLIDSLMQLMLDFKIDIQNWSSDCKEVGK